MKSAFFLALCVAIATAQITIYSNFTQQAAGSFFPTPQYIIVQNNLPFASGNSISSVTFQVCVRFSIGEFALVTYPANKQFNTFYSYVGAITSGNVNGTAPFFVNGLPGTYTITASVFYIFNGQRKSQSQDFSFTLSPVGSVFPKLRDTVEEESQDDAQIELVTTRDQSDGQCQSCGFSGVVGQPTWNGFQFKALVNLYGITVTMTTDPNIAIYIAQSLPTNMVTNQIQTVSFQITAPNTGYYPLNITLNYKKGSARGTPAVWYGVYTFQVTSSKKREVSAFDEQFEAAALGLVQNQAQPQYQASATESAPKTVSIQYAFGAAVAGVALVAAVAIVAVVIAFRSKKNNSTIAA